jgi:hypothetical protein
MFYRSRELIPGYKVGCGHWRSVAVQTILEPENCQGVLEFYCGLMRVSGFNNVLKAVLKAVVEAKSVTNNLPILSVLGLVLFNLKIGMT